MKTIIISTAVLLMVAVPCAAVEATLADLYLEQYGMALPPPLVDDGQFFRMANPVELHVQALLAAASSGLGWYTESGEHLLAGSLTIGADYTFVVDSGPFGLYLITETNYQCYSDPSLNGNEDRLAVYSTPVSNEYFLGWEDCLSYDGDYNDVVLIASSIAPAVPSCASS